MNQNENRLPNTSRINAPPIIIIGLTKDELMLAAIVSVPTSVAVVALMFLVLGIRFSFFGPTAITFSLIFVWAVGNYLREQKRDRPYGYYQQKLAQYLSPKSFIKVGEHDIERTSPSTTKRN